MQAIFISAMAAQHNFMTYHDPEDYCSPELVITDGFDEGQGYVGIEQADIDALPQTEILPGEKERADSRRDSIAKAMWDDYIKYRLDNGYLDWILEYRFLGVN